MADLGGKEIDRTPGIGTSPHKRQHLYPETGEDRHKENSSTLEDDLYFTISGFLSQNPKYQFAGRCRRKYIGPVVIPDPPSSDGIGADAIGSTSIL